MKMESTSPLDSVTDTTTTFMDLVDDCLFALFERLPIADLSSIADVCTRFRAIARRCYSLSKKTVVYLPTDAYGRRYRFRDSDDLNDEDKNEMLKKTAQILRYFGSSMIEIEGESIQNFPQFDNKFLALLVKHCSGTLKALTLRSFENCKVEENMRPLVSNLRKFHLLSITNFSTPTLVSWLTDIEDLKTENAYQHPEILEHPFTNLRLISLHSIRFRCSAFIIFLKKNPNLKEIVLRNVKMVDNRSVDVFGDYSSQIEKFHFINSAVNTIDAKSFRNLPNLSSLALCPDKFAPPESDILLTIREIISAKISLKHLTLQAVVLTPSLCEAVSELVHLETLNLSRHGSMDGIEDLSTQLKCLTDVDSGNKTMLTLDKLETVVSRYQNLHRLIIWIENAGEVITFDSEAFEKIVSILQKRPNKMPLHIQLPREYKLEFSEESVRRHSHILTVINRDKSFAGLSVEL